MLQSLDAGPALAAFDLANQADPRQEPDEQGQLQPQEWLYGQRMSQRLAQFCPQASLALQLAARAQHLERWVIPREQYARDRAGYLQWRSDLKAYHARRAAELLRDLGYDEPLIERVGSLLRKEQLKHDAECQTLEDVACLVFLQYHFAAFAAGHAEEKVLDIVRKTWRKMSPAGQQAALQLPLDAGTLVLVGKALA